MSTDRQLAGPRQLATKANAHLRKNGRRTFDPRALAELMAAAYDLSFVTEESHAIRAMLVLAEPRSVSYLGRIPKAERRDYIWRPWRLDRDVPATLENLAKIARSTDPRSSAIGISLTHGRLRVWGLIDQQDHVHAAASWDALEEDLTPVRPGRLQVVVEDTGHVVVWDQYRKIAALRGAALLPAEIDALGGGHVWDLLRAGFRSHLDAVRAHTNASVAEIEKIRPTLARLWVSELRRLLLRMRSYRCGGAILITPEPDAHLDIRYGLRYDRLQTSMLERASRVVAGGRRKRRSAKRQASLRDASLEVDGANRFVSLLTRVDGLVVATPELSVVGYGAKIECGSVGPAAPGGEIRVARNAGGTEKAMRSIPYEHYGTRHQSMFRYCQTVPGSVGFLMSQDGAAKAVTQVRGNVALWDGIVLARETRPRRGVHKVDDTAS